MVLLFPALAAALQPPTREQLERYRRDGSLPARVEAALRLGNHTVDPRLVGRLGGKPAGVDAAGAAQSNAVPNCLQPTGKPKVFALLIAFADYPASTDVEVMDRALFGDGTPTQYPYESLRSYYLRSSYGLLEITGATLGWYTAPYPRSAVPTTKIGKDTVILDAVSYFDDLGHDFSQYDNDGDGEIDYFLVFWTGPPGDWASFWWAYLDIVRDSSFMVDGKRLGYHSWQWEKWSDDRPSMPWVAIHETGHALGLPDFYDYGAGIGIGPPGGVGTLDIMDGSHGDHNCFSKLLLGWIEPAVLAAGSHDVSLRPSASSREVAVLLVGDQHPYPYGEYFMVQNRQRQGNDASLPGSGLMIWHVDARLSPQGGFLYNNSSTDHKLLRLMEADGLEEIEQDRRGDAGDFYRAGAALCTDTTPNSRRYDGVGTGLCVHSIAESESEISLRVSFEPGCAVTCDVAAPVTSWPGLVVPFRGSATVVNCGVATTLDPRWTIDGTAYAGASVDLPFPRPGSYTWSFLSDLGGSRGTVSGAVRVCEDLGCWQWQGVRPMDGRRLGHATTKLLDGRVLVVGGGGGPELFDPLSRSWSPAGASHGSFAITATGTLLGDGRVLVVGSTPSETVDAELFDPADGSWSVAGRLAYSRFLHGATRMSDGRVLIAGGTWLDDGGASPVLEAEVFDPETGSWHLAGSIGEPMDRPRLTPLGDGRVLLTGNHRALLFDPETETWTAAGDLIFSRRFHEAVGLKDGRVMVIGGEEVNQEPLPWRAEIFDPATGDWSLTSPTATVLRVVPTAVVVDSGQVVVCGGAGFDLAAQDSMEIYDPETDEWTTAAAMGESRYFHTATLLDDGTILVVGGTATEGTADWTSWVGSATVERFAPPSIEGGPPRRVLRGR